MNLNYTDTQKFDFRVVRGNGVFIRAFTESCEGRVTKIEGHLYLRLWMNGSADITTIVGLEEMEVKLLFRKQDLPKTLETYPI